MTTPALQRFDRWIYRGLFGFSAYLLPAVIAVFSVWAMTFWPEAHPETEGRAVAFRALLQEHPSADPLKLDRVLERAPKVDFFDTKLSESPVWFQLSLHRNESEKNETIEFPSRHLTSLACWDRLDMRSVGQATRDQFQGGLIASRRGFAYPLPEDRADVELTCQAHFIGPARLTVEHWKNADLSIAARSYERNSGLLDGGLIVLSVFVLITALINRNSTYLLFAVWLTINLRMAALSAGWDTQWLDMIIPADWIQRVRLITVALIYVVTVTLYKSLFREHLQQIDRSWLMRFTQWSCPPVLVCSLFMGFPTFLPMLWVCATITCATLVFYLVRILLATRSTVAAWYGASIAVMLASSLYEVLAAALGYKSLIGSVNSVTAALSSSLLASLAIAAQMRDEHTSRLQAQAKLQQTYEAIPIGLFTLDSEGAFLSANPTLIAALGPAVLAPGSNRWDQYFGADAWLRLHHMLHAQVNAEIEVQSARDRRSDSVSKFLVKATLAGEHIEGSLEDITERSRATPTFSSWPTTTH